MSTMPHWDKRTQPPLREWLLDLAIGEPGRTAVRILVALADDAELEQRYRDPEYWRELANRWLRADYSRRQDTARSYLSRARIGIGLSPGRGSR